MPGPALYIHLVFVLSGDAHKAAVRLNHHVDGRFFFVIGADDGVGAEAGERHVHHLGVDGVEGVEIDIIPFRDIRRAEVYDGGVALFGQPTVFFFII